MGGERRHRKIQFLMLIRVLIIVVLWRKTKTCVYLQNIARKPVKTYGRVHKQFDIWKRF